MDQVTRLTPSTTSAWPRWYGPCTPWPWNSDGHTPAPAGARSRAAGVGLGRRRAGRPARGANDEDPAAVQIQVTTAARRLAGRASRGRSELQAVPRRSTRTG